MITHIVFLTSLGWNWISSLYSVTAPDFLLSITMKFVLTHQSQKHHVHHHDSKYLLFNSFPRLETHTHWYTHCYTLLHTAIHCYTHTVTHWYTHCYTLLYIHCYTLLHTAIQLYTQLYTWYTQLYTVIHTVIHSYTVIHTVIHMVHTVIHSDTQLYTVTHSYTQLYSYTHSYTHGTHSYTQWYTVIHSYTQLYTVTHSTLYYVLLDEKSQWVWVVTGAETIWGAWKVFILSFSLYFIVLVLLIIECTRLLFNFYVSFSDSFRPLWCSDL